MNIKLHPVAIVIVIIAVLGGAYLIISKLSDAPEITPEQTRQMMGGGGGGGTPQPRAEPAKK